MNTEIIYEILPPSIRGTFDKMEIAEEEISAAKERHAHHAELIEKEGFMSCCPRMGMTDVAYRAHCRQMLDRLAWGDDTSEPTAAEMCMVLMDASLKSPLKRAAAEVYRLNMLAAFPHVHQATLIEPFDGDYPGHIQEEHDDMRRRVKRAMGGGHSS